MNQSIAQPSNLQTFEPSNPDQLWQTALGRLKLQMTTATFDFCLKSSRLLAVRDDLYQVGVPNPQAAEKIDWLDKRLRIAISKVLMDIAGAPVTLEFTTPPVDLPQRGEVEPLAAGSGDLPPDPSRAGQLVAAANYHAGYFEKGGSGYGPLPHHTSYFWIPLLGGPAFALWNLLVAQDKRSLASPAHYWTPPVEYTFTELVQKLNRAHPRYISGDEIECTKSREARQAGQPFTGQAACCHSPRYDLLRFKTHPRAGCGMVCLHWKIGLLEILSSVRLVTIQLNDPAHSQTAYKFTIQTWRMLPILTPAQCRLLTPTLQDDYHKWLRAYGHLFGIPDLPFWQRISDLNLVPLMPTHDQPEIEHNFEQRQKLQTFLKHAVSNPNYRPGNGPADGEVEDED